MIPGSPFYAAGRWPGGMAQPNFRIGIPPFVDGAHHHHHHDNGHGHSHGDDPDDGEMPALNHTDDEGTIHARLVSRRQEQQMLVAAPLAL